MAQSEDSREVETLRAENARLQSLVRVSRQLPSVLDVMAHVANHVSMDTPADEELKRKHVSWIRDHAQVWRENLAAIDADGSSPDASTDSASGFAFRVVFNDGAQYSWIDSSEFAREWVQTGDWTAPFTNTPDDSFAFGLSESWGQEGESPFFPLVVQHGDIARITVTSITQAESGDPLSQGDHNGFAAPVTDEEWDVIASAIHQYVDRDDRPTAWDMKYMVIGSAIDHFIQSRITDGEELCILDRHLTLDEWDALRVWVDHYISASSDEARLEMALTIRFVLGEILTSRARAADSAVLISEEQIRRAVSNASHSYWWKAIMYEMPDDRTDEWFASTLRDIVEYALQGAGMRFMRSRDHEAETDAAVEWMGG